MRRRREKGVRESEERVLKESVRWVEWSGRERGREEDERMGKKQNEGCVW